MNGNYYLHRISLTAWRKRSALLLTIALISIIIFGMQFTQINNNNEKQQLLGKSSNNNVKFIMQTNNNKGETKKAVKSPQVVSNEEMERLAKLEQPSREEILKRRQEDQREIEQQLGIPYVPGLDHLYVPKKRIVHLDLKGAPPQISYLKRIFSLIKNLGATGILLEYEDMFPYTGKLKSIAAKNAYTQQQIQQLLTLAENSNLEIIPLIQTFGHLEFALKTSNWTFLREVPSSPQSLCPSRNQSLLFIGEMVAQIMQTHKNSKYLHIGCDEVFQMGECDLCRLELRDTLFVRHVRHVAKLIKKTHPKLKLIIWDDMLRHLTQQSMLEIGSFVEPMIWVYAEDIYRFVQPQTWSRYAAVFNTAWTASAFKGAFGETLIVPDAKRHLENNLRWLNVMNEQDKLFRNGFAGIVLTGWQRYDHFAVLCELLPAGLPSLALSLLATSNGYFNSSLKNQFLSALSCPEQSGGDLVQPFINLDLDPYMWNKMGRCMFPGYAFFRITYRLQALEKEYEDFIKTTTQDKAWLTEYNVRRNYSLPLRVDELMMDVPRIMHGFTSLIRAAVDSMLDVFDNYTINEWIEQKIYPYIVKLELLRNQSIALKSVNQWPIRPLPSLKELERFGVPTP